MKATGNVSDGNLQILEEASEWFVEFRLGEPDARTRRKFFKWLRRSPEHIRAYIEISSSYVQLPAAGTVPQSDVDRLIARAKSRDNVVSLPSSGMASRGGDPERPARPVWLRPTPVAACLAAVAGCALLLWFGLDHSPVYETQTGEQRTILLDDGSKLELNARSKVRVQFTPARRDVEIVRGQAFFHVAKDPRRPFRVRSGDTEVRAVGTQFDVYRRPVGTTVTVLEGRVVVESARAQHSFAPSAAAGGTPIPERLELSAGEQAVVTVANMAKPRKPNVDAATAWTQGLIEFDETPLSEAAAEFNRYSNRTLIIAAPSLATFPISGVYSSTDLASLVLFLRNQPDLTVTETATEIRITPK